MAGKVVTQTSLDTVRIEVLGEGRAVNIPAALVLAVDRVLRHVLTGDGFLDLSLDMVEDDRTGWQGWEARTESTRADADPDDVLVAHGDTPWAAVKALADAIEQGR